LLRPIIGQWVVPSVWREPDVVVKVPDDIIYQMKKMINWRMSHSTLKLPEISFGFGVRLKFEYLNFYF